MDQERKLNLFGHFGGGRQELDQSMHINKNNNNNSRLLHSWTTAHCCAFPLWQGCLPTHLSLACEVDCYQCKLQLQKVRTAQKQEPAEGTKENIHRLQQPKGLHLNKLRFCDYLATTYNLILRSHVQICSTPRAT